MKGMSASEFFAVYLQKAKLEDLQTEKLEGPYLDILQRLVKIDNGTTIIVPQRQQVTPSNKATSYFCTLL